MEWCRMFLVGLCVCALVLGGAVSHPWQDLANVVSKREQKRQELLKMLGNYAPNGIKDSAEIQNSTKDDLRPPPPPNATAISESSEESERGQFPDMEHINTYRDYMEQVYGTQEGIDFLKRDFGPDGLDRARARFGKKIYRERSEVRLANAHYNKVNQQTRCRIPVLTLVRVRDLYPDPSKDYAPECTLLHRCSDTTGCCSKGLHCVPTEIREVPLHFFNIQPQRTETVKLLFENHTSCECRPINDMPRLQDIGNNGLLDRKDEKAPSKCQECPVPFTSRTYEDGRCGCDCFDRQKPCLRIKRGKEPLTEIERRCVEANHCHIPECEHGHYDLETGRCPPRHDEAPRTRNPRRHPHRWASFERD